MYRFILILTAAAACAATYDVGPGRALTSLSQVPWDTLRAGDTVLIRWRAEPYREKWTLAAQGTARAPITVRGVSGPGGRLPVIDGENATTASRASYTTEQRGVVQMRTTSATGEPPRYIVVEKLEIRGARPPFTFTAADGKVRKYPTNADALYIRGEHITIRGCTLHDSSNGLFVATPDRNPTRDILVEGNYLYDNGVPGGIYDHNSYTAALGITFQYNHYGPLRKGARGNNLKDRSAGLVVRYNWIEGGNRQLDLVDAEDSSALRAEPTYRESRVYGNILIEPAGDGNNQIVHYGGDSNKPDWYRKGKLYFSHNTVVSRRTDRTVLFRLSTADESVEARNNIFYTTAGPETLAVLNEDGRALLSHNWIRGGWRPAFTGTRARIEDDGTGADGASPGFRDEAGGDFRLSTHSLCAGRASRVPGEKIDRQYVPHQRSGHRRSARDIGAEAVRR